MSYYGDIADAVEASARAAIRAEAASLKLKRQEMVFRNAKGGTLYSSTTKRRTGYLAGIRRRRKSVVAIVRKEIRSAKETKEFYGATTASISVPGDTSTHTANLSLVALGTDQEDRQGEEISPEFLQIRGILEPVDAAVYSIVRLFVVRYTGDDNAFAFSWADMLAVNIAAQDYGTYSCWDHTNVEKDKIVLWDRTYNIKTTTASLSAAPTVHFNIMIPRYKLRDIHFTSATKGLNQLFLCAFSSKTNASGDAPHISYNWMLRFKEN